MTITDADRRAAEGAESRAGLPAGLFVAAVDAGLPALDPGETKRLIEANGVDPRISKANLYELQAERLAKSLRAVGGDPAVAVAEWHSGVDRRGWNAATKRYAAQVSAAARPLPSRDPGAPRRGSGSSGGIDAGPPPAGEAEQSPIAGTTAAVAPSPAPAAQPRRWALPDLAAYSSGAMPEADAAALEADIASGKLFAPRSFRLRDGSAAVPKPKAKATAAPKGAEKTGFLSAALTGAQQSASLGMDDNIAGRAAALGGAVQGDLDQGDFGTAARRVIGTAAPFVAPGLGLAGAGMNLVEGALADKAAPGANEEASAARRAVDAKALADNPAGFLTGAIGTGLATGRALSAPAKLIGGGAPAAMIPEIANLTRSVGPTALARGAAAGAQGLAAGYNTAEGSTAEKVASGVVGGLTGGLLGAAIPNSAVKLKGGGPAVPLDEYGIPIKQAVDAAEETGVAGGSLRAMVDAYDKAPGAIKAAVNAKTGGWAAVLATAGKAIVKLVKSAKTTEEKTAVAPVAKEVDDLLARVMGYAGGAADDGESTLTQSRAIANNVDETASDMSAISAVDNTITPTPTANARGARSAAPAMEPTANGKGVTPPTPQPAPRPPLDPTETGTARLPARVAPTEGLEPTEVVPRGAIEEVVQARPRNLDDDAAAALVRETALREGTLDVATLASKAGLSSSQTSRVLQLLVRGAKFRQQVADIASSKAGTPVPLPPAVASRSLADLPLAPRTAPARPSLPDPALVEAMLKRGQSAQSAIRSAKAVEAKVPGQEGARGIQRAAVPYDPKSPGAAPLVGPKGPQAARKPFDAPDHEPRAKTADAPRLDMKAFEKEIHAARQVAKRQLRDLTPERAFATGEDAVHIAGGDPYADFADLTNKANKQSKMGAAMLDEINGHLGLSGSKRVRTPKEAWAALIRKDKPTSGESLAETIRNRIEALDRSARMMRTIPGWEAFDISGDIAALEAAAKDLSHLENTGIRSLGKVPF